MRYQLPKLIERPRHDLGKYLGVHNRTCYQQRLNRYHQLTIPFEFEMNHRMRLQQLVFFAFELAISSYLSKIFRSGTKFFTTRHLLYLMCTATA